jgi:signal transduction histidine kinase/BarA-like signal transduction histidine kinase
MGLCRVKAIYGCCWLLVCFSFLTVHSLAQPIASQGSIDLSDTDFPVQRSVELNGEWKFYWQQLVLPQQIDSTDSFSYVQFPHLWNEDPSLSSYGYATYGLKIFKPETHLSIALQIPDLYTAYTMYINGTEVAKNGTVATTDEDYIPFWLPKTISIDQFDTDTLQVVLHVSNFKHSKGGIRLPIIIGSEEHLQRTRTMKLGYTLLLTGSLFMIGLFFMGLYLFGRHERSMLYFSIVCFFFSYRIFGTDLYPLHYLFPELPWWLTVKAEYFSLYFSAFLFSIFVKQVYPKEISRPAIYAFTSVFGGLSLITLFFPAYYFTMLINLLYVVFPFFVIYITWVYWKAVGNNREGSRFALTSVAIVFVVLMHNLLEYKTIVEENLLLNFVGFFSFFFLQSLILTYRFTNSLTKARNKAEQASIAKSQFLSTMSHEIRTPLNAVIGLSELLLHTDSEREKNEFAETIKESGENLLEIINNILDYSKFETMGIEVDQEPVNIKQLVHEMIRLLSPLKAKKDLSIIFDTEDIPEYVLTDPTLLKQILINLVGNAIKFTQKGSITISLQKNSEPELKGDLRFMIADSGSGISNENIHRLFKIFSQVDSSRTRRHGGTGLGLVISKKLVEALGGEIWFKSTPDKGTIFYFTIQAETTSKPTNNGPSGISSADLHMIKRENLRILIAEDNIVNQKVLLKILRNNNLTADVVNNGQETLHRLKTHSYDLILMDMEMPFMDGIEATKNIRRLLPESEQPIIIAVTANAFIEDRERCINAGMDDFLTKPISLEAIKSMLNTWFD